MQVIYEVREESNHKEKLYPVATAANSIAANIKVDQLNKRLAKNRGVFQGLVAKLRGRLNGSLGAFSPSERKAYETLEYVNVIKEYRSDFINDKRIDKFNPSELDEIQPLPLGEENDSAPKKSKVKKRKAAKKEPVKAEESKETESQESDPKETNPPQSKE